jgi:hypothetical protein
MFNARMLASIGAVLLAAGCSATPTISDPVAVLAAPESGSRRHLQAMEQLDPDDPGEDAIAALHRMIWQPGYTPEAREAAVDRLAAIDLPALQRTLRLQLPRMVAWEGLTRLCEIIAERGWIELTPALVSSWARPAMFVAEETDRPEYRALVALHGEDRVVDVLFDVLIGGAAPADESGGGGALPPNRALRERTWQLLHRLGERDRLVALLAAADVPESDLLLADLRAAAVDFGITPVVREEILWVRRLRQPEHRAFWAEAAAAVKRLPPPRRAALELRDVPVAVACARHAPELLIEDESEIFARLDASITGPHPVHGSNFDNFAAAGGHRLHQRRGELTWGDLAALTLGRRALEVPEVVAHVFDYAERDRRDESTEYGGVIALDPQGRFEVQEFPPRVRRHDREFLASQEMLDAAYTALFHFHFHAQRHRNEEYAGPGFGDVTYADNTRANCLVLTFLAEGRMNVDFYRHGRVLVDLGVIERTRPG